MSPGLKARAEARSSSAAKVSPDFVGPCLSSPVGSFSGPTQAEKSQKVEKAQK